MGRRTEESTDHPPTANHRVHDPHWAAELRDAALCAGVLLALLTVADTAAGRLTLPRTALWTGLGVLLFVVLLPPRVTAGPGWVATRGLLRKRVVRTDALVSVRWVDGVSRRLLLRDAHGARLELDPDVLIRDPELWRLFEQGTRLSTDRGLLLCGRTAVEQLSRRIDGETVRTVFRISGLR
ncbi:hypothetical protein [Streptomyces luteolus]|uniref:Integral membrane protein n=1 Tax=Streptomyces luteolus TaxID=3043615 RepID=A0ABT6T514_9ACTN|nr:hypothetical protein [Streptomyces sp. B-S-A12]MDI3422154.1 hypothetical protein [Streptomyces sp. B-S-A12]